MACCVIAQWRVVVVECWLWISDDDDKVGCFRGFGEKKMDVEPRKRDQNGGEATRSCTGRTEMTRR